jgi:dTDP-4-amino-4,6-dideoxygalactose transaminase
VTETTWKVPLADIDLDQAEQLAVDAVLRSRWLSMGARTEAFELACAAFLDSPYALAVSSGTAALHLACLALELGAGDEVILPSLTFVACANVILYTGAVPVFVDITSSDDLTISPGDIEAKITPRTKAIMVMHYGGRLCDMEAIKAIAGRHGLAIIEDAAHAPGASLAGKKAGTLGEIGCFSFFANKNLTTGEGGLVVTPRRKLAEKLHLLRSHGMTSLTWDRHRGHAQSYDVVQLGYNYRMDELRAAIGLEQLKKLVENNNRRMEIASLYRRAFAEHPWLEVPFSSPRGDPVDHIFIVLLKDATMREAFVSHLRRLGIQTSRHYPPIHQFSYYRQRLPQPARLPITERAADLLVTLPLFPGMSAVQIEAVIEAVNTFTP